MIQGAFILQRDASQVYASSCARFLVGGQPGRTFVAS